MDGGRGLSRRSHDDEDAAKYVAFGRSEETRPLSTAVTAQESLTQKGYPSGFVPMVRRGFWSCCVVFLKKTS